MTINTKQLKKSLTIQDFKTIFEKLEIPLYSETPSEIIYYNLDKHKSMADAKPKLYYYKESGVISSYTRGCSYDIIALVQQRLSILDQPHTFVDAVNFILSATGKSDQSYQRLEKQQVYDWESSLGKFLKIKRGESCLKEYDRAVLEALEHSYYQGWVDEGISCDTMEKYQIGFYPRTNAITIPCFDRNGRLVGIRVRNLEPDREAEAKYLPLMLLDGTVYKFPTNDTLYGINYNWPAIEQSKHVIITEGEKSVLKADTWWHEQSNVVALYGSNLGLKRRNQLLKLGVNHVTIGLDSDFLKDNRQDEEFRGYWSKVMKMAELFKGFCKVDVVLNNIGLDGYKCSPFDFSEDIWGKLWENREVLF